jgi:hypothetical protein
VHIIRWTMGRAMRIICSPRPQQAVANPIGEIMHKSPVLGPIRTTTCSSIPPDLPLNSGHSPATGRRRELTRPRAAIRCATLVP